MKKKKKNCPKCIYFVSTILNPRRTCLFGLENDICMPEYKELENGNKN